MELIVHVVRTVGELPNVGATVLNKILVDCDFTAYKELGVPMTAQKVQHQQNGPISAAFVPVTRDLEELYGAITSAWNVDSQKKYKAHREANLEEFSDAEREIIQRCIDRWSNLNAAQTSEESHRHFGGWEFTDNGQEIPYETAWISMRPLSQEAKDYALELAPV